MNDHSPAFTQSVVKAMRSLYPEELADRSWDNVGLLLENADLGHENEPISKRVLLTNDLTPDVVDEAIDKDCSVIVTYPNGENSVPKTNHPPDPFIFRGLKSVTLQDPHQNMLLQLARANIAVYSPHTAVDAAHGGVNDWLADIVTRAAPKDSSTTRTVVQQLTTTPDASVGYGRLIHFSQPAPLQDLIQEIAAGLGDLPHIMMASPKPSSRTRHQSGGGVRSVAVCAGSGWDVLKGCDADVLVTGEMTHHNALRASMLGQMVITVFHSNSERQFLKDVMLGKLQEKLAEDGVDGEVVVSKVDCDPYITVDVEAMKKQFGQADGGRDKS